jgi:ADP-heptose:LPS heptosyltransferase
MPAPGVKRFSGKTHVLQWIDHHLGVPACALLTLVRRVGGIFGSDDLAPPRSLLFLKLAEQGSTVLAHDTLRQAVARVGRENVYFLVFEENRFILDLLGLVPPENVFAIQTSSVGAMLASTLAQMTAIRRRRIEACIDLEFFARSSAALAFLSGARLRVGLHAYFGDGPYRGDLLTHRVIYNPHLHTSAMFASLLQVLDVAPAELPTLAFEPKPPALPPLFQPGPEEQQRVGALLADLGVPAGRRLILLNANASDLLPQRKWQDANYVLLARRLLALFPDVTILFTGSPEEAVAIAPLVRDVDSPRCVSIAGLTALRELLVLYTRAEVLVTNDSGPAHFAALTPIDVVALFGPETPLLFGAPGPRSHPLWAGLACSPCVNAYNNRRTSCTDNQCMKAHTVEKVADTVSRIYQQRLAPVNS